MSYIVAFVKFMGSSVDYPVECFRTDITVGEPVLVRLGDGRLKHAVVARLRYLNWNCEGRIECKEEEAIETFEGLAPPPGAGAPHGLASWAAMADFLEMRGWAKLKPASKSFRAILSASNSHETANILLRMNGVDLQILLGASENPSYRNGLFHMCWSEGRIVRHFLSQTTFNLYEGIARFAEEFQMESGDYDRFFVSVGSSSRQTQELSGRLRASSTR
jgi:hypothetical protein